jgi:hypothetical protein
MVAADGLTSVYPVGNIPARDGALRRAFFFQEAR